MAPAEPEPDKPEPGEVADGLIAFLDRLARRLALEVHTLWLVFRHRETPWPVKAVLILLLAYLASPVDLIPDVIPVLGMLDDLVVAAVALWLAYRLTPPHVMEECRAKASEAAAGRESWISRLWRRLTGQARPDRGG